MITGSNEALYMCFLVDNSMIRVTSEDDLSSVTRKPAFGGFRPGPTQNGLYSHRSLLED